MIPKINIILVHLEYNWIPKHSFINLLLASTLIIIRESFQVKTEANLWIPNYLYLGEGLGTPWGMSFLIVSAVTSNWIFLCILEIIFHNRCGLTTTDPSVTLGSWIVLEMFTYAIPFHSLRRHLRASFGSNLISLR